MGKKYGGRVIRGVERVTMYLLQVNLSQGNYKHYWFLRSTAEVQGEGCDLEKYKKRLIKNETKANGTDGKRGEWREKKRRIRKWSLS